MTRDIRFEESEGGAAGGVAFVVGRGVLDSAGAIVEALAHIFEAVGRVDVEFIERVGGEFKHSAREVVEDNGESVLRVGHCFTFRGVEDYRLSFQPSLVGAV